MRRDNNVFEERVTERPSVTFIAEPSMDDDFGMMPSGGGMPMRGGGGGGGVSKSTKTKVMTKIVNGKKLTTKITETTTKHADGKTEVETQEETTEGE